MAIVVSAIRKAKLWSYQLRFIDAHPCMDVQLKTSHAATAKPRLVMEASTQLFKNVILVRLNSS